MTADQGPAPQVDHRDYAEILLAFVTDYDRAIGENMATANTVAAAAVHAALAQVDALDRLTAAVQSIAFPALEVSGSVMRGNCVVRPVTR